MSTQEYIYSRDLKEKNKVDLIKIQKQRKTKIKTPYDKFYYFKITKKLTR